MISERNKDISTVSRALAWDFERRNVCKCYWCQNLLGVALILTSYSFHLFTSKLRGTPKCSSAADLWSPGPGWKKVLQGCKSLVSWASVCWHVSYLGHSREEKMGRSLIIWNYTLIYCLTLDEYEPGSETDSAVGDSGHWSLLQERKDTSHFFWYTLQNACKDYDYLKKRWGDFPDGATVVKTSGSCRGACSNCSGAKILHVSKPQEHEKQKW